MREGAKFLRHPVQWTSQSTSLPYHPSIRSMVPQERISDFVPVHIECVNHTESKSHKACLLIWPKMRAWAKIQANLCISGILNKTLLTIVTIQPEILLFEFLRNVIFSAICSSDVLQVLCSRFLLAHHLACVPVLPQFIIFPGWTCPSPSHSSTASPGFNRSTLAACWPSLFSSSIILLWKPCRHCPT